LINFLNFSQEELKPFVKQGFRIKQIYNWVYHKYIDDFQKIGNLPKSLRDEFSNKFTIGDMEIIQKEESSDGTIKYLFKLYDNRTIETVLLKMQDEEHDENGNLIKNEKNTICISTQVGCKVGCAFCLTAKGGFIRNLSVSEIVEQVWAIKKDRNIPNKLKTNIVFMGMGEPLDNLENLTKAIKIIADELGLGISPRRQTVSTSGISSKIDKLGVMNLGVNLAISLHAVDDEVRSKLIPINKAYNIKSIIDAVKKFPYDKRKRVMFEYLVIKGLNDSINDAKKLIKLLEGIKAKVNLIYFNPYPNSQFERPSIQTMENFANYLNQKGLLATIRASRGIDISAACGQLREKTKNL
jgi:23S rRNA (adenine2503-C2)-methyltransferase